MKRKFPELVVGNNNEIGSASQQRLRRFEQQLIKLSGRSTKAEVALSKLLPKVFDLLRECGTFDGQGEDLHISLRLADCSGDNEEISDVIRYHILQQRSSGGQQCREFIGFNYGGLAALRPQLRMSGVERSLEGFVIESGFLELRLELTKACLVDLRACALARNLKIERDESAVELALLFLLLRRHRLGYINAASLENVEKHARLGAFGEGQCLGGPPLTRE